MPPGTRATAGTLLGDRPPRGRRAQAAEHPCVGSSSSESIASHWPRRTSDAIVSKMKNQLPGASTRGRLHLHFLLFEHQQPLHLVRMTSPVFDGDSLHTFGEGCPGVRWLSPGVCFVLPHRVSLIRKGGHSYATRRRETGSTVRVHADRADRRDRHPRRVDRPCCRRCRRSAKRPPA